MQIFQLPSCQHGRNVTVLRTKQDKIRLKKGILQNFEMITGNVAPLIATQPSEAGPLHQRFDQDPVTHNLKIEVFNFFLDRNAWISLQSSKYQLHERLLSF